LLAGARLVAEEARRGLAQGASGSGGMQRGEPASIAVRQTGPLTVEVSADGPAAAALEYGTSRMAARPFMGPALETSRGAIAQLVRRAVPPR
jgi:hypothetical protein